MILYLKDYCKKTGYPLRMIKLLCKQGELPYHTYGRRYLVDEDVVNRIMAQRATDHRKIKPLDDISFRDDIFSLRKKKTSAS